MPGISKTEADAHDKILEAAADLSDLIESSGIEIDEFDLEELSIFLARNAAIVREMLKSAAKRKQP